MTRPANFRFFLPLTFAASMMAFGCQQGVDGTTPRAGELESAPGIKVTISGAGELGHDKVQAIAKLLESKGQNVGAAMVRLKKDDGDASSIELELWGAGLPSAQSIPGILSGGFPELASATIQVSDLAPGSGPKPITIEAISDDMSPEEAKTHIIEQLEADGVDGAVDVKVEDAEDGRRVEIRVEKTIEE